MGVDTQKFIRKPLYVEAVRVNANNFDELVAWCNGEVQTDEVPGSGTTKKFIKVRVHNPKNPRQTKAFIGDWLLYTERGYKVYTNRAFRQAFDSTTEEDPNGKQGSDSVGEEQKQNGQEIPKFYFAPHSDELTETQPHKHAVPLTLEELMNIIRNELVGEELQHTTRPEEEPQKEPLPPQPKRVGGNIEIQDRRPESAVEFRDVSVVAEEPSPETGVQPLGEVDEHTTPQGEPHEYVEATPEAIAQAVEENEQARSAEETVDEIIESHSDGPIVPSEPVVPQQAPVDAAEGKRVLSEREQQVLGPDQVRAMVSGGDVILAQDLATEQA